MSTVFEEFLDERIPQGLGGRWYGVYPATVSDIKDPDGQGRVKVKLPWCPDTNSGEFEAWARLATMMAGNNRGTWFIPDVGDEVLVAFAGSPNQPFVLGALWNGSDSPPQSMDGDGKNPIKMIRSRNGVKVTLDDNDGQEKFICETPGGQKITLQDSPGSVQIEDSNQNMIKLEAAGITLQTSANVTVNASAVNVTASSVSVSAPMATFSGTVQAQTVICTTIVSSTYTPGAGNIW